jgi:hypothetical protein
MVALPGAVLTTWEMMMLGEGMTEEGGILAEDMVLLGSESLTRVMSVGVFGRLSSSKLGGAVVLTLEMMMLGGGMTEEGGILAGDMVLPGPLTGMPVLLIALLDGTESILIGVGEIVSVFAFFELWSTESLHRLLCINEESEDSILTPRRLFEAQLG